MTVDQCILLFTRYPQPGKVKTRMIEHLGPQGAAALHVQLTEQVIRKIEPALRSKKIQLQIYYCEGSELEMRAWLGDSCSYHCQQGRDLGERMAKAFAESWQQGAGQVLLIGSDCPDIDAVVISCGLKKLRDYDLILGPAADGGYYLIGLRSFAYGYKHLFDGITWGTELVLQQTILKAKEVGLRWTLLPQLHDIDRPEDLVHFNYHPGSE